jgi:hypothetical protein
MVAVVKNCVRYDTALLRKSVPILLAQVTFSVSQVFGTVKLFPSIMVGLSLSIVLFRKQQPQN